MLGTGKNGCRSVLDRNDELARVVGREMTAGTTDTPGWSVMQERRSVASRESTDAGKLFEMAVTGDHRDCEVIQEEKRGCVTSISVER